MSDMTSSVALDHCSNSTAISYERALPCGPNLKDDVEGALQDLLDEVCLDKEGVYSTENFVKAHADIHQDYASKHFPGVVPDYKQRADPPTAIADTEETISVINVSTSSMKPVIAIQGRANGQQCRMKASDPSFDLTDMYMAPCDKVGKPFSIPRSPVTQQTWSAPASLIAESPDSTDDAQYAKDDIETVLHEVLDLVFTNLQEVDMEHRCPKNTWMKHLEEACFAIPGWEQIETMSRGPVCNPLACPSIPFSKPCEQVTKAPGTHNPYLVLQSSHSCRATQFRPNL